MMCVPPRLQWRVKRIMRSRPSDCTHRICEEPGSTPTPEPPSPSPTQPPPVPLPEPRPASRLRERPGRVPLRGDRSTPVVCSQLDITAAESLRAARAAHAQSMGVSPRSPAFSPHASLSWPTRRRPDGSWPHLPPTSFSHQQATRPAQGRCPPRHRSYHVCSQSRPFWSRRGVLGDLLVWPTPTRMCVPLQLVERVEAIMADPSSRQMCMTS
jgi:hypothetical protein